MECYFDGNNQFYTIGGLVLLGLSLGANLLTCVYRSKESHHRSETPLITSSNYIEQELSGNSVNNGNSKDEEVYLEIGKDKSTNTSPHLCSVRRYTPVWGSSHDKSGKNKLPDWVRKEYSSKKKDNTNEYL